jgi:asparagine synthase (glutamine-hydrolysing)
MAAVPDDLLLQGHTRKVLHRQAMRGILPEKVRVRPDKAHMDITYEVLNGAIAQGLADSGNSRSGALFDPIALGCLLMRYCAAPIDMPSYNWLWGPYAVSRILSLSARD